MPKIISTTVYTYDELADRAKEVALAWFFVDGLRDDWWDSIYEDASNVGIQITGFDIDRRQNCEGEFTTSAESIAEMIVTNHGDKCETYNTAKAFLAEVANIKAQNDSDDSDDSDGETAYDTQCAIDDDAGVEFKRSILEDYRIMLSQEYDYLTSREKMEESIRMNEYTFTEDGRRFD